MVGKSISNDKNFVNNITGITISPKKSFCIMKIWMKDCILKDPDIFVSITNLSIEGCLFKKHNPEF